MAALDFPNSPTNGQQYNAPNGAIYTYDGVAWTVSGVLSTGSAAGGDLTGAYPNPLVAAGAVGNAEISDVAWSKVTGAPTSFPPSGSASGSLAGSYPGPSIAASAVRGTPSSGGTAREISKASIWGGDDLIDVSIPLAKLAAGAGTRGLVEIALPLSFTNATTNTWIALVTTGSMTTRGGRVLIVVSFGGFVTANPTGGAMYFSITKDNNTSPVFQAFYSLLKSPVTANVNFVPPTLCAWDSPAAGSHNYTANVWQGTNTAYGTGANDPGFIRAMEFA